MRSSNGTPRGGLILAPDVRDLVCNDLHIPDQLFIEVAITEEGTPLRNEFTCSDQPS